MRYRAFSCFQSTAWERRTPKSHKPKRGQGLKPPHPSQSEGSIPDGSSRGILKGGTIRAGASCSPLEPASLHTFLPEQESMALLASTCSKPIVEQMKRLKMGIDNRQQVPPLHQTGTASPACSLRRLRRQLPPGGSCGVPPLSMRTIIFYNSLLPLQSPVSLPCRRVPQIAPGCREPFLRCLGKGENKCFPNKYRDNPYYTQKIRGNSNLSVRFTGGVVKTTKIGIEITAGFVYNYLIVVQGT